MKELDNKITKLGLSIFKELWERKEMLGGRFHMFLKGGQSETEFQKGYFISCQKRKND